MTEQQKRKIYSILGVFVVIGAGMVAWRLYEGRQYANAAWPALEGGVYASEVTRDGVTSLIPGDELYESGVVEGGIPALTNPKYDSVLASDVVIADDLYGIDVALNGEHRFYPVQVMNWHEVVNDSWGGMDVAITYCPLCGTGVVYNRDVAGEVTTFEATGQVYNNNTILKDSTTGSLWVQGLGLAVQGEQIGKKLEVIPSSMMTWSQWKNAYPSGAVLSVNTGIARDYTRHPYGNYDTSKGLYFPMNFLSPNFGPKWIVFSVSDGTNGLSFSETVLLGTGLNTALLGEESVVAIYDFNQKTARIFQAGEHTFTYDYNHKRLTDNETGSVWNVYGQATSGELKGESLAQYPASRGFWSCIAALNPTWTAVTTASPQEEVAQENTEEDSSDVGASI